MYQDIRIKPIPFDFFDGIEDNTAFSFKVDENGRFVPVCETKYHLFTSDIYPFLLYGDELESLNQYCYEIAMAVQNGAGAVLESFKRYASMEEKDFHWTDFTKYEFLLSCQSRQRMWEQIYRQAAGHLAVTLLSFLERALKKLWLDMFRPEAAVSPCPPPKSRVKLYGYIERIFGMSIQDFEQAEPEIFRLLDMARQYRNSVVHGQPGHQETEDDYEKLPPPPFKLTQLIELTSTVLDMVQWKYESALSISAD